MGDAPVDFKRLGSSNFPDGDGATREPSGSKPQDSSTDFCIDMRALLWRSIRVAQPSVFGRFRAIAPHQLIVRYLRIENHFPDSGLSYAALHEAVPDPEPTIAMTAPIASDWREIAG